MATSRFADGLPADYAAFGTLIHPLRALAPIHLSLGNHDGRGNFWRAFPHDAARVASVPEKQAVFLSTRHANWFLLDSLDLTAHRTGDLGPATAAVAGARTRGASRKNRPWWCAIIRWTQPG